MPSTGSLHGIVPIPVTTFDAEGRLDGDGLRRQVAFCLSSGAHGLLYPGVVSEFYALTDDERTRAVDYCVEEVAGRIPFIVGVSATNIESATSFARHAAEIGADAVMAMPPFVQHFFPPSLDDVKRYMAAIGEACRLPIIVQNARIGYPVGLSGLVELVEEVELIEYVKQETNPPTHELSQVVETLGGRIRGAFGGVGGVFLLNELDRGAVGSMPAPAFVDVLVDAYQHYVEGRQERARSTLARLGMLFTRELLYNVVFIKEVLRHRGVISSATVRIGSPRLDDVDLSELGILLEEAGVHRHDAPK